MTYEFQIILFFTFNWWWNPLDEGEEESSMEECGLIEAR